ncbi:MAG: glycosyltransferase [Desulfobacteraceae bacterium]|nr:MAG: glycosyltransferase [Desulfobacteraceae bacterium]
MKREPEKVETESGLTEGTASHDCWDFFDRIYCISVDERTDRRQEAKSQFGRVGLSDRVEFVIVKRDPGDCELGIYESHISCIKRGLESGAKIILIFEDDILFERFSPGALKNCIDFLSNAPHWNILFLGCLVKNSKRSGSPNVLEVRYRSLAHAYAVNRGFAETLIEKPRQSLAYDEMLSTFETGCYALYPSMAFQSSSRTDNTKCLRLDRFRRLWGGLRLIQKMNEIYHLHRRAILLLHVLAAFFILLWII